jgi:hypothetical protein
MKMIPSIKPKILVVAIAVALLFIGFNAYQPPLENIQEAEFNKWYAEQATKGTNKPPLQSDGALSGVTVLVSVYENKNKNVVGEWLVPRAHATNSSDHDMLLRVLQLIRESNLFHLEPDGHSSGKGLSVSIVIKTPAKSFQTTIPMRAVDESIQLKNLLKLLETHDSLPPQKTALPTSRL